MDGAPLLSHLLCVLLIHWYYQAVMEWRWPPMSPRRLHEIWVYVPEDVAGAVRLKRCHIHQGLANQCKIERWTQDGEHFAYCVCSLLHKRCHWFMGGRGEGSERRVDVRLSLCLIKRHATKAYGWTEVQLPAFLTSARDGRSCCFNSLRRALVAHFIGSWVGIVAPLGVGHKTIFYARLQLNPDSSVFIIFDVFDSNLNLQCSSAVWNYRLIMHSMHIGIRRMLTGAIIVCPIERFKPRAAGRVFISLQTIRR